MAKKTKMMTPMEIYLLECWASGWAVPDIKKELSLSQYDYMQLADSIKQKITMLTSHNRESVSTAILFSNKQVLMKTHWSTATSIPITF